MKFRDLPKVAIGSASVLAALYFGLSPRVAKRLYGSMLFHPYPYPEGDYHSGHVNGIVYRDVFFQAKDGTRLHGWHFEQTGAKRTILFSHGNTGNLSGRRSLLQAILRAGENVLLYDYRGYGKSVGRPDMQGVIDDGCAAYDYLAEKCQLAPDEIVLYGESLGAAISCQISLRRKAAGLVLQSGFASLTRIGREHVPLMHLYPAFLFPQPLLDNLAILKGAHPPLLILHGVKDATVPFHHAEEMYARASGKKSLVVFPEANHTDIPEVAGDKFVAALKSFISELEAVEVLLSRD
ncbi:MAG: alpha/beta hydrolase [Candidatus Obscuribacterales bacterium]|nr:alpha/beta hydrolase [Candidatus Obscuribacterales bacterium]